MLSSTRCLLLLSLLAVFLGGCQWPFLKQPEPIPEPVQPAVPAKRMETQQEHAIRMLLLNGEYTLSQDQLLTPANDNAFDYFRAVLKLDPNNQRAKGGIQGIVLRYVDLARQAAARGQYERATTMLNNARIVDPDNLLIKEVSEGLREQIKSAPPPTPYRGNPDEYLLEASLLGKEDPRILARLNEIAQKLKATDGLAMIVARNDVEGRWIYQQLRAAVPGYLVRGDIQIGNPPRVKLVPHAQ
ncbi:tetratricopeptide repeat protein [Cellvibrio japonicus]|uniref:Putative lipoprotein n=1 Tax=Cellvibrio japonicus (strain Ueda107) TaxID=498211 RepID=B3PBH0_CELJU|nr:hypothetical protein [Cellvibrio japonicus]ACE85943.1 putative lipoprotein [Cellvibrio japonicus Ueda107]QEI13086.1 hypothetical protein FY117_13225 [Cellvibrio japonicus]QEI16660.1 hypothetical protein FY116_13230 [Cellvibrio japonicus]QEI20238.1 hypothetical protein FY115_13225 [Cellvibrio japonicus]